jgi:guanine deaminase
MKAIRGRLLTFLREPVGAGDRDCLRYLDDGLITIDAGRIVALGEAADLLPTLPPGVLIETHPGRLILPGFIDLHIHMPQTRVIGSYGAQLLDWLERYTFIEEQKYADPAHAAAGAAFFLDELLRNGTTTAVVYGSVHAGSAEALFAAAEARGMGVIGGKAMMDRDAPEALRDTAQSSYDDGKALIARWHGRGRQRYAVTPRFAVTSTPAQLEAAGALLREHPGVYLQTHLSENHDEIAAVRARYPAARDYTDVYDAAGLLGERSLFGHCLHLDERELDRLSESGSVAVFCPTSNLFLGSGLFDRQRYATRAKPVRTGLATDVGGGTSYSMLRTLDEGYKVLQLRGQRLSPLNSFYMMTLGNARALSLEGTIGSIVPGADADLVVLDSRATPQMALRMGAVDSLANELFLLQTCGDDRAVAEVYVAGKAVKAGLAG